jgi:hypothetical protein
VTDGTEVSGIATVTFQVVAFSRGRTYTLDSDFQEGSLTSLVSTNNDLVTSVDMTHFNYVWVPVQSRGTLMRLDAETGRVLGEYRLYPDGRSNGFPSRVAIDGQGNCWVGNERDNSVLMIGTPQSSWVDKNHNGVLETSSGQGDIRPWPNTGGVDSNGGTATAQDELIVRYVRVTDPVRHLSVNRSGDVWVSGSVTHTFELIQTLTGGILRTEGSNTRGGFGGFMDDDDVLWSTGNFLRWDTHNALSSVPTNSWNTPPPGSWATAKDAAGNIWVTYDGSRNVLKFAPDGTKIGEYPHGSRWGMGIAIDGSGDVWVAHSHCGGTVGHLKNNGTLVGVVPTAGGPTAVSIDRKGRVWVSTVHGVVQRINPSGGAIGADGVTPIGAVDLTSPFLNGYLWTYGDFTGSASALRTQHGLWSVVFDSGLHKAPWAAPQWNATLCNDGTLRCRWRPAMMALTSLPCRRSRWRMVRSPIWAGISSSRPVSSPRPAARGLCSMTSPSGRPGGRFQRPPPTGRFPPGRTFPATGLTRSNSPVLCCIAPITSRSIPACYGPISAARGR